MGYIKGKSEGDLVRDTMEGIVEGLTDGPTLTYSKLDDTIRI